MVMLPNRNYNQIYKKILSLQIQYKDFLREIQSTGTETEGEPALGETLIN